MGLQHDPGGNGDLRGLSAEDVPHNINLEAQMFRMADHDVYPGKIMVIRAGSFAMHPVDDESFDQTREGIRGISFWGAFPEWQRGLVRIEDGESTRSALMISAEEYRPPLGVPSLDTWIARADTLRAFIKGRFWSFGSPPLSGQQMHAAAVEVGRVSRLAAIQLLKTAPPDQHSVLRALARIADAAKPTPAILTDAIQELIASVQLWEHSGHAAKPPGTQPITDVLPAGRDLVNATGISPDTFRRIRKAAGIRSDLTGHAAANRPYSPEEVDRLIAAVQSGGFLKKQKIVSAWKPWGTDSVAT